MVTPEASGGNPSAHAKDDGMDETPQDTRPKEAEGKKKRGLHYHIGLWSGVLILCVFLLSGLGLLAITGRTIVFPAVVTKQIEARVNAMLAPGRVSIGEVDLMVDRNLVPRVTARHVGVIDPSGAEIARLNDLRAVLSRDALMDLRVTPDTLRVSGAQLTVRRRADGSFAFDFGGGSGAVKSAEDVIRAIDEAFATPSLEGIERVEAREITVTLEDAQSGRIWQATDARVDLSVSDAFIDISLSSELFNGTEDLAQIDMAFHTGKGSLETAVSLDIRDIPAPDFALQTPALQFLSVIDAPLSASMSAQIDAEGQLAGYEGDLRIGAGAIVAGEDAPRLDFGGAQAKLLYDPAQERAEFETLELRTEALTLKGRGQVLARDFVGAIPQSFVGQFNFSEIVLSPEGMFADTLEIDEGAIDMKLELSPFSIDIGQIALRHGDVEIAGDGEVSVTGAGWTAGLDVRAGRMDVGELLALWPVGVQHHSRDWIEANIPQADFSDVSASLRFAPQTPKRIALGWSYADATIGILPTQPPIENARGYGTIFGNAMTIVLDEGQVHPETGGPIEMAGSVVRIADLLQKPALLEMDLKTESTIEAGLSFVAGKPFSIMKDSPLGPRLADGRGALDVYVAFPLKKPLGFQDVTFDIDGTLREVSSDVLMPGQTLASDALEIAIDSEGVEISGAATIGTAKLDGVWTQRFGPEASGSQIAGDIVIDQNLLDTFNVSLPQGMLTGTARGQIDVRLDNGAPPAFTVTSALEGVRLSIPALGYTKAPSNTGSFRISGTAGDVPRIEALSIEAGGLSATGGRVKLSEEGAFRAVEFDRVAFGGWLDVGARIFARGAGAPVGIELRGGRLDLARAKFGSGSGGGTGSGGGPISGRLDRLVISDGLALTGVSLDLRQDGGLRGQVSGQLNGGTPVTVALVPTKQGTALVMSSSNAGGVIQSAGLLDRAEGGNLSLQLVPVAGGPGRYSGHLRMTDINVLSAPALAELLSAISVVGLLDQLAGSGIVFSLVEADFSLRPGVLEIRNARAEGPSLGITAEGYYDTARKAVDLHGVVSPVYFINALGQVVSRRGEGLFGFTYTLKGATDALDVGVNPLSILTPGFVREIFRTKPVAPDAGTTDGQGGNGG